VREHDAYAIQDYHLPDEQGEIAIVTLDKPEEGEVRTHFERLIRVDLWRQVCAATRESTSAKKRKTSHPSKEFEVQSHETSCIAGLSFVEAVLWQMEALETDIVWEVAAIVLRYISTIPAT